MNRPHALFVAAALFLGVVWGAPLPAAGATAPRGDQQRFEALVRSATDESFAFQPSYATYMGVHDHDRELEDYSKAAIDRYAARLRATLAALETIDPAKLDADSRIDYAFFQRTVDGRLFEWTVLRPWQNDPSRYGFAWSIENLIARPFAPAEERLRSVIARLALAPRLFANGKENLENPPPLFVQFAAEDLEGSIDYLETDVTRAFASVKDPSLLRKFAAAKKTAEDATRAYVKWLREDLMPRSHGTYVLGEPNYRRRLHDEEMIDEPVDTLLAVGSRELERLETRYRDCAARIAPGAPMDSVIAMMRRDHPAKDGLLDEVRALLASLRDYCVSSHFIDLPSEVPLGVRPTPEYAASRSFASFDGPGPLETKARDAYYNVTLPGADWTPDRVEQHLQGYSRWTLPSVSIHECYPGHYVHYLFGPKAPTYARKTMGCGSFAEGWGLYVEEALFDHGYAKDDPKKEFGMLRWALVRSCRLQVGLRVHTRGMSMDEATQYFVDHAGMERPNAEREAYRAAFDPTYIVYTVGALQIRKLRDDLQKKEGTSFDLAKFHDTILSQGALPVVLLRRMLLNDDGPSL
ncbi:MAG TPA: DUF885 domain-containing protein [Candidatus Eisenbacteria bacterium]